MDLENAMFEVQLVGKRKITLNGAELQKLVQHRIVEIKSDKGLPEVFAAIAKYHEDLDNRAQIREASSSG